MDARLVEVETELAQGLPYFSIIGLGDTAVQEARYRIQAAVRASEIDLPHKRITINLAPADLRKDGAALDLPMALGLLAAADKLSCEALDSTLVMGELALCGHLRPVRGALALAALADQLGFRRVIVPADNGSEADVFERVEVVAASNLSELIAHLEGRRTLDPPKRISAPSPKSQPDLRDVRGQPLARRALEVAATGGHNLLMVGPPGSGKTMLARRLPSILPALTAHERIQVTKIWSAAGLTLAGTGLIYEPPFRAPHHTITSAGMIGGGHPIRPGEISLAHQGVLFLDELPELPRRVLESLRQPLEDRQITVSRARQTVRMPADLMLVGAANPCPCGWLGHDASRCRCRPEEVSKYLGRLSGPLLDRIDLVVEVSALDSQTLLSKDDNEDSATVRERVEQARGRALRERGCRNAHLVGSYLQAQAPVRGETRQLLEDAIQSFGLSGRGLDRVLRVARSIADLAGRPQLGVEDLAEALRYRPNQGWAELA